ncbi:MAG: peptidylprolyl isomerase [Gemmatimonadota bacterium]|nr:peptidylprolyl isomerase [Gemmatimonadota bacterium]
MTRATLVPKTVLPAILFVALACVGDEGASDASAAATVPDSFDVVLSTSGGEIVMRMHRAWSPRAVDRVYELVSSGFYDGARFYRVNEQFAQFGFSGRPERDTVWMERRLPDEPVRASNVRGTVAFGRAGPNSRNFVLFVNLVDNTFLDTWSGDGVDGFPPVGRVERGLEVAENLYSGHGDAIVAMEDSILARGNAFLDRRFPGLDSIVGAEITRSWTDSP